VLRYLRVFGEARHPPKGEGMNKKDKEEFELYLRGVTDAQVHGCYDKENSANRQDYAELCYLELIRRGLA